MGLAQRLLALRQSRWRLVYIPLAVGLALLLFLGLFPPLFFLSLFLLGFFLFAVPYWFGERRLGPMALGALAITVATAAGVAALLTSQSSVPADARQESLDGTLVDGRVAPVVGAPDATVFNFTVLYTPQGLPARPPQVNITSITLGSLDLRSHPMSPGEATPNGTRYYFATTLDRSFHTYHFALETPGGWIETRDARTGSLNTLGPSTTTALDLFAFYFVAFLVPYLIWAFGFFLFIAALYAFSRRARERRRALLGGAAPGICPHCRAAVPRGATECPVCGRAVGGPGT